MVTGRAVAGVEGLGGVEGGPRLQDGRKRGVAGSQGDGRTTTLG